MITNNKIYKLHDRQSSYLLLTSPGCIITNSNYSEVMLFTHELEFVRTIHFPGEKFISHYEYKAKSGNHFLLYEDESEMFVLLDVVEGRTTFIRDIILQRVSVSPSYLWTDHTFTALAYLGYPSSPSILSINTLNTNVTLIPFEERFNKAPQFAYFLEAEAKHKAWPIRCNQEYMYKPDFYGSAIGEASTIQIINSAGTIVKKFSIKKELEEELTRLYKRSSVAHELAERFPHNVEYQNGWMLIIWENKVVVIAPDNQRTSILMDDLECSARAKFIRTDNSSAKFVILVQDHGGTKGAELHMYDVSAQELESSPWHR